jgi:ribulose-phosphate 3-epimerase
VNPGFGGQKFIPHTFAKITAARQLLGPGDRAAAIEVDGGVDSANAGALVAAGASILVAGASIFGQPDPAAALHALRRAAEGGR